MQRLAIVFPALLALAACAGTGTNTRESTGGSFNDSLLTNRVRTALISERGVTSSQIHIETFRGVVQLSGFVDSQDMVDKAVNATRHVSGVKAVEDRMTVKSDTRADAAVAPWSPAPDINRAGR